MPNEQRIRAFLFYLSLIIFLAGLPSILSFALGYKFDARTLRFTKTGLITIRTLPEGANIYLNGKLLNDRTPYTINELIPGSYSLKLDLEHYYPWDSQVKVQARKVVRLEKIILFPKRPHIKQLNLERISSFWPDQENNRLYYLNREENILYLSNLEGEKFEEIGSLPETFIDIPRKLKVSPDKEKMLIFNAHQVAVLNLDPRGQLSYSASPVIFDYPRQQINEVFWHSDSYHLILVTDKFIQVLEADNKTSPVNLVNLNKKVTEIYYDVDKDALYFIDSQKSANEGVYDNVYKLDLHGKAYFAQGTPKNNKK